MLGDKSGPVLPTLLGILLTTTAPVSRALAQSIGSVAAVNQSATGVEPGGGGRMLTLGQDVVFHETIKTSNAGSAQIAFVDRSTLNVGRNSNVLIDQFVYDPNGGKNAMALTLTKGMLRFVGGQISHTTGATITTPVAVVGVRGGSATVGTAQGGGCQGVIIINHIGSLTLKNNVSSLTISKPGYGVCVTSANEPFPTPFLIPDSLINQFMQAATSGTGQTGGSHTPPASRMFTQFGFNLPRLQPPGSPPGGNPFDVITIINSGDQITVSHAQNGYGWD
jgi:hypothetical protein